MVTRSTATADEINRFSAIADEWWDEQGKFRPLHLLNPIRVEFVRDALCRHFDRDPGTLAPLAGLKVLDVGCGGGLLCEPLSRLGATVTGIDAGEETIAVANAHARQNGLQIAYKQATPEALVANEMTYDAVVSLEVVEHVSDVAEP